MKSYSTAAIPMSVIILSLLGLFGCSFSTEFVIMAHPKSQDVVICDPTKSRLSAPRWKGWTKNCIKQLEGLGYKKAEDLSPQERESLRPKLKRFEFKGEITTK